MNYKYILFGYLYIKAKIKKLRILLLVLDGLNLVLIKSYSLLIKL